MTEENKQKVIYLKGYMRELNTISCCRRTIEILLRDIEELRRDESEAKKYRKVTGSRRVYQDIYRYKYDAYAGI